MIKLKPEHLNTSSLPNELIESLALLDGEEPNWSNWLKKIAELTKADKVVVHGPRLLVPNGHQQFTLKHGMFWRIGVVIEYQSMRTTLHYLRSQPGSEPLRYWMDQIRNVMKAVTAHRQR